MEIVGHCGGVTITVYGGKPVVTDTQVFIALGVALVPGILALRLATGLYK